MPHFPVADLGGGGGGQGGQLPPPPFLSQPFLLAVCVVSVTEYTIPALHGARRYPPKYVAQKVRANSLRRVGQLSKFTSP